MAEFHEIGSSQFTDVTPTGEEKIQISASQRTTLQNIANLAPAKGVKQVEITDFAIPGLNITKDGESFLFYANDASNIPNSNHGATSFVGVAIASPIFITGNQRLLYYMMVDTASGKFYTGRANLEDDVVDWNDTPVTRLGQAVQVTAFTEPALSALLYSYKPGDFIPFYTNSVTASTANQFPESGIFNGFISMGRNERDYFQIFAFKTGSTKAYLGACIGSTTQWTALGGGGAQTVIKLPGLDVALNESTGVITYTSTELVPLSAGTTLLLCFELADSDARFSPCGNVVVHYDLPPANNLWGTIAGFFSHHEGFFDNATSSNGFINARRRGAGIIDFQCLSALVDGYPGLQVYLKHILVLG